MSEIKGTYDVKDSSLEDLFITATEFKNNLGKYLDLALNQKETIISKNGKRIARLAPYIKDYMGYQQLKEEAENYNALTVSYDEFLEISDKMEGRMEYINGQIIMQSAPNSFHQDAVGNLYMFFKQFLKDRSCKVFLAPLDVTLYKKDIDTPDVIQPDLLVICDKENINEKGRYSGIPTIVVEVLSPSTRSRDMLDKLNSFMSAGCKEYLVIDVSRKRVLHYTFKDLEIDTYDLYTEKESFNSKVFPELAIKVSAVFEE